MKTYLIIELHHTLCPARDKEVVVQEHGVHAVPAYVVN